MGPNGQSSSSDIEIGEQHKFEDQLPAQPQSKHIEMEPNPIAGVQAALGNPMPMYDIPPASGEYWQCVLTNNQGPYLGF